MSQKRRSGAGAKRHAHASVFAALGDETRLALLARLSAGRPYSVSQLSRGSKLTRQAISKHLRVLERAGMVHSVKSGREKRFRFSPQPFVSAKEYLDFVSEQWDQSLKRLKSFVEP